MTEESQWTKDHEAHIAQLKKRIHFLPQTEHERYIYGMWLLLVAAEVAGVLAQREMEKGRSPLV